MISVTCKCGDSTMVFKNLTAEDFPNGLELACCAKAAPKAEQASVAANAVLAKIWDTPEEDAAWEALEAETAPEVPKPSKKNKAK